MINIFSILWLTQSLQQSQQHSQTENGFLQQRSFQTGQTQIFSEEEWPALYRRLFKRQSRHPFHPHYKMYSQYSQFVLDLYRQYFGSLATRDRFKARRDPFFQFHLEEESEADQEVLHRLSISITKVTGQCFLDCIDSQYQLYTTEEESCVRRCVQKYFKGYQDLTKQTNRVLYQQ